MRMVCHTRRPVPRGNRLTVRFAAPLGLLLSLLACGCAWFWPRPAARLDNSDCAVGSGNRHIGHGHGLGVRAAGPDQSTDGNGPALERHDSASGPRNVAVIGHLRGDHIRDRTGDADDNRIGDDHRDIPGPLGHVQTHRRQPGGWRGEGADSHAIPQDRAFRADYSAAIRNAMIDLQSGICFNWLAGHSRCCARARSLHPASAGRVLPERHIFQGGERHPVLCACQRRHLNRVDAVRGRRGRLQRSGPAGRRISWVDDSWERRLERPDWRAGHRFVRRRVSSTDQPVHRRGRT